MKKKIAIIGAILFLLMLNGVSISSAADSDTYVDAIDDVLDESTLEKISRPNIDIEEISYSVDGKEVTVSLKLAPGGKIQNSESTFYSVELATTEDNYYTIGYVLGQCLGYINDEEELEIEDCSGAGENELTMVFNLESSSEEISEVNGLTYEMDAESGNLYSDSVPDIDFNILEVDIGGPYQGKVGEAVDFSSDVSGGEAPYSYQWDFGDDAGSSTDKNPSYTYTKAGTYDVSLIVVDDQEEAVGSAETTVTISSSGSNGNQDEEDSGFNTGLIVFVVLIVIIVVVAVVAGIYIKKR